jgi:hypothetical protein
VNSLFRAGTRVQEMMERRHWAFCFIGGVANFRWGAPRLKEAPELLVQLEHVARRAEPVIGPFPRDRQ